MATDDRPDAALGDAAVALTAELVAVDSVNPGLAPGAAGEVAVVEHLRDRLRRSGFETHVVIPEGRADRPSLVATGAQSSPGPTVVLTGHLDTVGVEGMDQPFAATVDGDRLSGRGSSDMKAGVAAMVVAAEELVGRRLSGRVVLALVADEEDASVGAEAVLAALPGLGIRPDEGVNAVAHLGRLLGAIEARDAEIAGHGASLMVTVASGGDSPFVLARSARALVERRTVPGECSGAALDEVEELLGTLRAGDATVDATARLVVAREAWRLDPDGAAATLADVLEAALAHTDPDGTVPQRVHAPYWMEAPLWQEDGIPTLVCGPAGGGLHAADEWVDLGQVRRYAVALTAAVGRWAAEAAGEHAH